MVFAIWRESLASVQLDNICKTTYDLTLYTETAAYRQLLGNTMGSTGKTVSYEESDDEDDIEHQLGSMVSPRRNRHRLVATGATSSTLVCVCGNPGDDGEAPHVTVVWWRNRSCTESYHLVHRYTTAQPLCLVYTLQLNHCAWCIHYSSTTVPGVYTTAQTLSLVYMLQLKHYAWCIHYTSNTKPAVYTTAQTLGLVYTLQLPTTHTHTHFVIKLISSLGMRDIFMPEAFRGNQSANHPFSLFYNIFVFIILQVSLVKTLLIFAFLLNVRTVIILICLGDYLLC